MFGKFWGLFFGSFWGLANSEVAPEPEPTPGVPVPTRVTDHVTEALDRLCEQFRGDPDS